MSNEIDQPLRSVDSNAVGPPFGAYSQAIVAPAGRRLMAFSGRLGMEASGRCPEGVEAQSDLILRDIDALLAAAGGDRHTVIRLSAFVTRREDMAAYMSARDRWVAGIEPKPASTLMIVSGFTKAEFLVEIEALAALP